MVDPPLFSFDSFPSRATSVAVFLALIGISTDADRADRALSEKNIALARVVSKEAKLYLISGPGKEHPNARPLQAPAGKSLRCTGRRDSYERDG